MLHVLREALVRDKLRTAANSQRQKRSVLVVELIAVRWGEGAPGNLTPLYLTSMTMTKGGNPPALVTHMTGIP